MNLKPHKHAQEVEVEIIKFDLTNCVDMYQSYCAVSLRSKFNHKQHVWLYEHKDFHLHICLKAI